MAMAACGGNSTHNRVLWMTMSLASVTTLQQGRSPTRCSGSVRKPPTFGTSIQAYNTSTSAGTSTRGTNNNNDNITSSREQEQEHCPYCEKYSQGPCGKLFQSWLKCTDNHPGKDPNNADSDWHLSACASLAQSLAHCLNQHESYYKYTYEKPFPSTLQVLIKNEEEEREEEELEELQRAWERLLENELKAIPQQPFPNSHKPILEFRDRDRLAVAMLDMYMDNDQKLPLLLVYIQDVSSETHELLCAGSKVDLFVLKNRGVLQCCLPQSTTQIQVSALYESPGNEEKVIFTHAAHVTTVN